MRPDHDLSGHVHCIIHSIAQFFLHVEKRNCELENETMAIYMCKSRCTPLTFPQEHRPQTELHESEYW